MKHPVIKLVGALVLLSALLFAYYQAINSRIESGTLRSFEKTNAEKLDSIIEAMESLATEKANKMSTLSARMCASAKLEAALLARSAEYRNHAPRENEMTVRVRNDRVVYPVGSAVRLEEYGDLFADDAQVTTGTLSGVDGAEALKAVLCACPLKDGAYYVLWVDEEDDPSLFTAYSDEQAQLLSSVEVAHGGLFLDIVDRGQGLVQDILAGITIVFEGEYRVGDVVDVGGYRGKVVEIGVRTTKLLGRGDNIKIISNRDVRNVLNMSRMNSWIDMEFTLSNTVPMQKLEEIMERELPEIGRSIPDIISGPIYKGIVSMNGNRVTVAVTCECNEEVSFRVQRELYAKFHEMFERESLPLV